MTTKKDSKDQTLEEKLREFNNKGQDILSKGSSGQSAWNMLDELQRLTPESPELVQIIKTWALGDEDNSSPCPGCNSCACDNCKEIDTSIRGLLDQIGTSKLMSRKAYQKILVNSTVYNGYGDRLIRISDLRKIFNIPTPESPGC